MVVAASQVDRVRDELRHRPLEAAQCQLLPIPKDCHHGQHQDHGKRKLRNGIKWEHFRRLFQNRADIRPRRLAGLGNLLDHAKASAKTGRTMARVPAPARWIGAVAASAFSVGHDAYAKGTSIGTASLLSAQRFA